MSTVTDTLVVGDIGGTHARFATVAGEALRLGNIRVLKCADYEDLDAALLAYLADIERCGPVCLALPGPVHLERVPLVNNPWGEVDPQRLEDTAGQDVQLLNDFTAQAHSLAHLESADLEWLRGSAPAAGARVIVGTGTGLGVGPVSATGEVLDSEAGQMHFAATTRRQRQLVDVLQTRMPRIVNETLISGPGLANLHRGLQLLSGQDTDLSPEEISEQASKGDADCRATLSEFSAIFGAVCGDFALGLAATGGVYLSGGLVQAIRELLDTELFLKQFNNKGGYRSYCEAIPIAVITHPYPGLLGAAAYARLKPH